MRPYSVTNNSYAVISLGELDLLFSYHTLIAFKRYGKLTVVDSLSATSAGHVGKWQGVPAKKWRKRATIVSQDEMDNLITCDVKTIDRVDEGP